MRPSATHSSHVFSGELLVVTYSRSLLGVASGTLFLSALGTLGFYAAHGDQNDLPPKVGGSRPLALNASASPIPDSERFVLHQAMGGMGGGGGMSGLPDQGGAKELIIQNWEKPTAPIPDWLAIGTGEEPNEREVAIRRAFDKRIDVDFNRTPLSDVLHSIGDKLNIHVIIDDKGLDEEALTPDEPVTIARKDARVIDILRQVLRPLNLTVKVDLEAFVVTNKKNSANEIRFYDLSYILPDNGVTIDLIKAIETMIEPETWLSAGGTSSITTVGSMLIVNAPQDNQEGIENLLRSISKQNAINLKPQLFKDKFVFQPAAKGSEAP
jgi:hypothetical protein